MPAQDTNMVLWVVQMLLNALLVGVATAWIIQRRRLLVLESVLRDALDELRAGGSISAGPSINTPLGVPTSTLTEKSVSSQTTSASFFGKAPSEAYRQALEYLDQGMKATEVARRTGLSGSEIQLLSKLSGRLKNNDLH